MTHTYEIIDSGVDHTGCFKFWLLRDDGREVKVTRKRVADLRRVGRIRIADRCAGDWRNLPLGTWLEK